ncbi:MAG: metal ABC transporter substrate-binding protein [Oscillospiraceae bacterium]|jgi:D-methionine transport system substrate-binding protein|nr:metal ABC transporter substrate-binding protein [Oscillospiraceae bacterium]
MKKLFALLLALLLAVLSTLALAEAPVKVSIGATPVPHAEVLEFIKPMMLEKGYDLQISIFDDYVLPNTAVESGELDANYFQHTNYMNQQNLEAGLHLVAIIPVHFEPMGVFKGKTEALADLPDGATIGVPNDTSNEARALLLLETLGLIELNPEAGVLATKLDITKNDKNLEIVEAQAASLPRMLQDLDLAIINGNYAMADGLSLIEDAVAAEGSDALVYRGSVNWVVVREGNEEAAFLGAMRECLNDQATVDFMTEKYQGSVVLALDLEAQIAAEAAE